jgi:hypothetical protein
MVIPSARATLKFATSTLWRARSKVARASSTSGTEENDLVPELHRAEALNQVLGC